MSLDIYLYWRSQRSSSCSTSRADRTLITAIFSGVRVSIGTLVGMRLRKVPPSEIIRPYISASKAGIELELGQMEAHYLAGGNVERVVTAIISADWPPSICPGNGQPRSTSPAAMSSKRSRFRSTRK
ncbi:MAG: flotillin-like FloA family protein [Thermomicrobiales bacterium]